MFTWIDADRETTAEAEELEEALLLTLRTYLARKRELGATIGDAEVAALDLIYDLEE